MGFVRAPAPLKMSSLVQLVHALLEEDLTGSFWGELGNSSPAATPWIWSTRWDLRFFGWVFSLKKKRDDSQDPEGTDYTFDLIIFLIYKILKVFS